MPRLDDATAARVETGAANADSGAREPVEEGFYTLSLREVAVTTLEKSKEPKLVGCPQWTWKFEIPEGEEHAGRQFWTNRILPKENGYQHADFMLLKFSEPFTAFGVPTSTDTDDLIGRKVRGYIIKRVIESGAKQGQLTNSLEELLPIDQSNITASGADDDGYEPF